MSNQNNASTPKLNTNPIQFRHNQTVFDHSTKKKVRFIGYNRDMSTAKVSVLVDHDKKAGVVSTKSYNVPVDKISVYRPKRKSVSRKQNNPYEQVKEFQKAFNLPVGEYPQLLTPEREEARLRWLEEEIQEQRDATTLVDKVDALIDQLYFIFGTCVEMGVDPQPVFDIVQRANMGKLENGKPIYRESDGKVQKPENWIRDYLPEPRIQKELEKQTYFAQKNLK